MALTQVNAGLIDSTSQPNSFKNRIINGAMMIDQRNAGASVTPANGTYGIDRWGALISQPSKFAIQQNSGSISPPSGFVNYLGATSLSAYAINASDKFGIYQFIEGYNVADLAWGTANATPITLSFKVYSSLTGTFGGSISNDALNRSYPFAYSIPTANTWTTINIVIAGDTVGTWNKTTNSGLRLWFGLGVGSTYSGTAGSWASADYRSTTGATSVVGTNGATFYITGVQLEKGSTATSFDYRPYGTELALCQRYCQVYSSAALGININANYAGTLPLKVTMRATPTLSNASFPSGGGTVVLQGETRQDVLIVYNSGSWGAMSSYVVTLSGIVSAEL